ncbi:hypothetical protein H4217_006646 [Coemansia sp. RSA 1939]|nr:hypothetical protein H4217_006646 [Coemansia sp. RSA 1939]KAJ2607240.1 hypothetical protein EV177_005622 [Coemansia sp. RSA 1804]
MALEARLVDLTKALRTERSRVSSLEHRTSQLESQMMSFKTLVLGVMRQSIHQLEQGLAIYEPGDSSALTPLTATTTTLAQRKSISPVLDHSSNNQKHDSESSGELQRPGNKTEEEDALRNPPKPHSSKAPTNCRSNNNDHKTNLDFELSAASPNPKENATDNPKNNASPRYGSEPGQVNDCGNISLFPEDNDNASDNLHRPFRQLPKRCTSAPRPTKEKAARSHPNTPMQTAFAKKNGNPNYTPVYARDRESGHGMGPESPRHRRGSIPYDAVDSRDAGPAGGGRIRSTDYSDREMDRDTRHGRAADAYHGRNMHGDDSRSRSRSRVRKRSLEYESWKSSHDYPGRRRAERSRSPGYDNSRRGSRDNRAQFNNYSPKTKQQRHGYPTSDALRELEHDLKARMQQVDGGRRNHSNYNNSTNMDSGALSGWDTGHNNDSTDTGGWAIFPCENENEKKEDDKMIATSVMPRSIHRIMNKKPISSVDKVLSWRESSSVGKPEPADSAGTQMQPLSDSSSDGVNSIIDGQGMESRSDTSNNPHPRVHESISFADVANGKEDDDDDDDDDDPLVFLGSRSFQAEKAKSMLFDSAGTPLTTEHLAPLWKASAWIPFESLHRLYMEHYKTELWTVETRKKIRSLLPKLPNISERHSYVDGRDYTLLFMGGSHLKNPKAYQRVFVRSQLEEPVLFFFLTTSVYWPLELAQADIICRMWAGEFHDSPANLKTVKRSDGSEEKKWFEMKALWEAAIKWLKGLAQAVSTLGCKYMLNKLPNWGSAADTSMFANEYGSAGYTSHDPDADLVCGLSREELLGAIRMMPVLLQTQLSKANMQRLVDEISMPM